jgi:hypothetical protein
MAATVNPNPAIHDCATCCGTGHVEHHVCPNCEGYGLIDDNGVRHISANRLHAALAKWAADKGWYYGVPIPSMSAATNRLVIARRAPFANRDVPILSMPELVGHVMPRELREIDPRKMINCWYNRDGMLVYIVEEADGKRRSYVGNPACTERFDMMIETLACRQGAVTPRSEAKAMMNLAERLTEAQVDSYLLNGAFLETSKRSGVRYVFRKGLPTIALRDKANGGIRFLAALCLHALAYFENTFCGSMAPSDDVLAALLLMRSDEHALWKNSNQHPIWALQSGV